MLGKKTNLLGSSISERLKKYINEMTIRDDYLHVFVFSNMSFEFSKFTISELVDDIFKILILLGDFHLTFEVELWNHQIPRQAITINTVF